MRYLLAALLSITLSWPALAAIEVLEPPTAPMPEKLREPPMLQAQVDSGALPPVAERLPKTPLVVPETDERVAGRPGGTLSMLIGRTKDTRLLNVYGYARLVGYDENFELVPDLLRRVEVEDGRIFTLYLREGHRWSDGAPFTAEDFRYYWEDVANNEQLYPAGPPKQLRVAGELPRFEVIDETTVRYSWSQPNPFFLPALAGARPLFIYMPAHFLKRFHQRYGDPAFIAAAVKEAGVRNWAQLHNRKDDLYRTDDPALPTLQPWTLRTPPPSKRFIAKRNPYFHRIDTRGLQLPYIDEVALVVTSAQLIAAKTGAGESDLQARGIAFADYTFLKENEKRNGYGVRLWDTVRGSEYALYPNLNANDPVWRSLLRDVRFRRALSLAIDREEINQVMYYGLGLPGNQSVLPSSPLYRESLRQAWADYAPKRAAALLDEIGLSERNGAGIRLLPDGRPLEIVVESAGESPQESDILQLIGERWRQVGVKLFTKPSQREVLRNRIFAGETLMSIWFGMENAVLTPDMSPEEFVPVRQYSYQWPKWGQYYETQGRAGAAPDMPLAKELMALYRRWTLAASRAERREIWQRILEVNAEQVYTIGLVAKVPQPVVVRNSLRNVPEQAIFNWDPGAQFGAYRMETFWFDTLE